MKRPVWVQELEGLLSYFQETENVLGFFPPNKGGTKEIVTGGVCTGLSGPSDLPECTCMWLQVWAMGKAKHDHRDHL